jgi:hypothetical protein
MTSWGFLAARLRDIAGRLGITERSAHGIVSDLTAVGYVEKQKDGRRNRCQAQAHLPNPPPGNPPSASPGPPRGRRGETAADRDRTRLRPAPLTVRAGAPADGRPGQPGPPHPARGP